jgi:hypothetical protein
MQQVKRSTKDHRPYRPGRWREMLDWNHHDKVRRTNQPTGEHTSWNSSIDGYYIKTVEENEAAKTNYNLYSFHKPEKSATNVNVYESIEETSYSQQLSTMQHVNPLECPYCFKSISTDQQGSFCNNCGGIFHKITRGVKKINVAKLSVKYHIHVHFRCRSVTRESVIIMDK